MAWLIMFVMTFIIILLAIKTAEICLDIAWALRWGSDFADEIMLAMPKLKYIEDWRETWNAAIVKYKREDYLLLRYLKKKERDRRTARLLKISFSFLRKYIYRGSLLVFLLSLSIPYSQYVGIQGLVFYQCSAAVLLLIGLFIQALALLFNNLKMGFINNFHLSVFSSLEKKGTPIYLLSIRTILKNFFRVLGRNLAAMVIGFAGIYSALFFVCPRYLKEISASANPIINWFHMLYFSVITASTTGFGDLGTTHVVPRMLFAFEIILGILYITVLVIAFSHTISPEKPDWILELKKRRGHSVGKRRL